MKYYVCYNQNGEIQNSITSYDPLETDQEIFGIRLLEVESIPSNLRAFKVVDGILTSQDVVEPEFDYRFLRHYSYAQVGEQLDMLWHDIDQGLFGQEARTGLFYQTIQNIKQQIPKT